MKAILIASILASVSFGSRPCLAGPPSSAAPQTAASQSSGPVKNPVMTVLRAALPLRQKNILAAIEAMPADKFGYKPTTDQMTFAHLVIHIAESNNAMCAKIADIPEPKIDELKETDSKDKLLAAARASFDYCTTALANVDDSKLGDNVDFGNTQRPRVAAVFALTGGWADHYAAAAMYLRLNGILPPTAQPKK